MDESKGEDDEDLALAEAHPPTSSKLATLVSMGFESAAVSSALQRVDDDTARALELLLNGSTVAHGNVSRARTTANATERFGAFCVGARVRVLLPAEARVGTIAVATADEAFEVLLDGGGEACVGVAKLRPLEPFELEPSSSAGDASVTVAPKDDGATATVLAAALLQKDYGAALFKLRDWGSALLRYKRALKELRGLLGAAPTVGAPVIVRPAGPAGAGSREQYAAAVVAELAQDGQHCDVIYDEPDAGGCDEEESVEVRRLTLAHGVLVPRGDGAAVAGHGATQCTLYLNAVRCALRQAEARQEEGPGGAEAKLARLTARRYAQVAVALALRLAALGAEAAGGMEKLLLGGGGGAGAAGVAAILDQQRLGTAMFLRAKAAVAVRHFRAAEEDALAATGVLNACAAVAAQLEQASAAAGDGRAAASAAAAKTKAATEARAAKKLAKDAVRLAREKARSGKELAREVAKWVAQATDKAGGAHAVGEQGFAAAQGGGGAVAAHPTEGPWTCPMCTFEHKDSTPSKCEICGHPSRGGAAAAEEAEGAPQSKGFFSTMFGY